MKDRYYDDRQELIGDSGDSFRNSVSVLDKKGVRMRQYPSKPSGRYHRMRLLVGYTLLAIIFILPFIKHHDQPYFLFDIFSRTFIIFGMRWYPHDFYIFAIGFLSLAIFIVLFTAVFGRIWCGWACPQTIFMELIYRKIEYLIEGNTFSQKRIAMQKRSLNKFFIKFSKHSIFIAVSIILHLCLVSYVIGMDKLYNMFLVDPGDNTTGIISIAAMAFLFYFNYGWFREQACVFVCPYGRLQSVLLDANSIIVAYNDKRGEPRSKSIEQLEAIELKKGDCIDCGACVRVCPTGIDIRNGLQLECVNCTACIDACDHVMSKINKPGGLIKYTSINNIKKCGLTPKFGIFTPRIISYSLAFITLLTIFSIMLFSRSDVEIIILKAIPVRLIE